MSRRRAKDNNSSWVWYSTPESVSSGSISVLAIIETMVAVTIYALIAVNSGTAHLTLATVIVPLFLLRTRASVAMALRISGFEAERAARRNQSTPGPALQSLVCIGSVTGAAILIFIASRLQEDRWISHCLMEFSYRSYPEISSIDVLIEPTRGLERAISIAAIFATLIVFILGAAAVVAFNSNPLFTRFVATATCILRRPSASIRAIPKNWYHLVLCTDSLHPPEILPGVIQRDARTKRISSLQPFGFVIARISALIRLQRMSKRRLTNLLAIGLTAVRAVIAAVPTYLFRYSVKGTAVLLLPMVWLVYDSRDTKPEHLVKSTLMKALFAVSSAILMTTLGLLLDSAVGNNFGLTKGLSAIYASTDPHGVIATFFPRGSIASWHVLLVLLAACTVLTYLLSERAANRGSTPARVGAVRTCMNAMGFLAVALLFALMYLSTSLAVAG